MTGGTASTGMSMSEDLTSTRKPSSRRFFLRGLGILLPTVLTIWILVTAYNFVLYNIAEPINQGVRIVAVEYWPYPVITDQDRSKARAAMAPDERVEWTDDARLTTRLKTRRIAAWWAENNWYMDLIGLLIAGVLIYIAGALLGSFIGRRLVWRLEAMFKRLPIVKFVYPSVKQVTDFFFGSGEEAPFKFNRVVAVQYPRKGIWSVGLVTGDTMSVIQHHVGEECMTVFIPSSPTPFTGYVITVQVTDVIDLPISIDEALRFTISGGVIVPPNQQLPGHERLKPKPKPLATDETVDPAAGSRQAS